MPKVSKYIWVWDYKDPRYPLQFFVGGRGDGKTYGALDGARLNFLETGSRFMFSRLTIKEQKQITSRSGNSKGNPFKKINKKEGCNIVILGSGDELVSTITDFETDEKGKIIPTGKVYGYSCSLVDLCDVRGQDFDDVDDWLIDEFIPEKHKRLPKGLGDALLNGIETINRDREDEGRPPLNVFCMANANDIYNPIFKDLGLVSICEKMKRAAQKDKYLPDRGIAIHLLEDSEELQEARSKRMITRIAKGTSWEEMAYNNDFAYNDFSCVAYRNIKGYVPIVTLNDMTIYSKKGSREIYISYTPAKCPRLDGTKDNELLLFKRKYSQRIYNSFVNGNITFESYEIKARILEIIL